MFILKLSAVALLFIVATALTMQSDNPARYAIFVAVYHAGHRLLDSVCEENKWRRR